MAGTVGRARPAAGVIMLLAWIVLISCWGSSEGALSAAECKEERRIGVNACKPVLYGRRPSAYCCERVRVSHVECVCPLVTRKLAALVDVKRAIRLIEGCGRPVPRHFKCGALTTP